MKLNIIRNLTPLAVITLTALTTYLTTFAQEVDHKRWVGLKYTRIQEIPYFKEIHGNSSALLPDHRFAVTHNIKGKKNYIFLEKMLQETSKKFQIMAVLDVGSIAKSEDLMISGYCSERGKINGYIIAIIEVSEYQEVAKKVKRAWKINTTNFSIIKIDTKNISCLNESYGI